MSLFEELKRRNVIKVAVAYIVVAWLVAQVLQLVFESFGTPEWVMKTVLVLMAAGFAFAILFAWIFELTPEGLKRESEVDRSQSITPQTGRKLNTTIIAVMALAIAYFAYDKFLLRETTAPVQPEVQVEQVPVEVAENIAVEPGKSIAVLPFVDMSPEQDQDYFTDGLTENLLNALAKLRDLKVAGRTSSFAFKNKNEDLKSIAGQLRVDHILEGSVQKSGERVRITAQLISADDGYHLWSETYDRTLEDIFAVQDEIATEVARAMRVTLLGQVAEEPAVTSQNSSAAYNDYLKGLYERNRDNMEGNERAMEYFRRALEQDPGLALAWAGLSRALGYVTGYADTDFTAGFEEARGHALRALELNPDLPEGHLALARIQLAYDWDRAAAEASLKRALSARPGDSEIRGFLARLEASQGRIDEAFEEIQQVVEQDPLDWQAQRFLGNLLGSRNRFEEALVIFDRLKEIDPNRPTLHWSRGRMFQKKGDHASALHEFSQEPFEFLRLTGEAVSHHHLQQQDEAVATLQTLISTMGESSSYQIAQVYAQWDDADNAMSWLERAYNIRDPGLQYVGGDTLFDPIRDDPRFQVFLRKMNLGS